MKAISAALVAALAGWPFSASLPAAQAARFSVVWSFGSGTDGQNPDASLIEARGVLYGTTASGGAGGGGTVFALDLNTGKESVLYPFCSQQNCTDGETPLASLIDVNRTLYGTTQFRGALDGSGTVFGVDTNTGDEKVLHSFGYRYDGVSPIAGLIDVKGKLYGTTEYGGTYLYGTVFAIDRKTSAEDVLYSFCSQQNCADGFLPDAGVIDVNGMLYGTTSGGGTINGGCGDGCGTVFALDPGSGAERVIYSFCQQQNCTDGQYPSANLINVIGPLYGTTGAGGSYGYGTVFSLDPTTGAETVLHSFGSGAETVLHSFGSGSDGAYPRAALIDVNGSLYGTTSKAGAHNDAGTAFALDPNTGAETVLHSFCNQQNCTDGEAPIGSLIYVKGTLYGTTAVGGKYGDGTVFALKKNH